MRAKIQLERGVFVGLFLTGQKLAESELVGPAQFASEREYTPEDSNALGNSLAKQSKASLVGHLVGQTSLQYDPQTDELLELWSGIEPKKRSQVLGVLKCFIE